MMSEEMDKYDRHRFDDLFYSYTQLFLHRSFVDVCWANDFYETNFERVSAFPIEIVRPYAERLLEVHGHGPLLHTIIAANFECEPMPSNGGRFAFVTHNKKHEYTFKKDVMGLIAACGVDMLKVTNSEYNCILCEESIRVSRLNLYESLRRHARNCEMVIDCRYLKPLTSFWKKSDRELYKNFLNKSVAQTMLTKLAVLIARPKKFDELPLSSFVNNRFDSLQTVLQQSPKCLRLDDDALDKMVQAGYHALSNQTTINYRNLKKSVNDYALTPADDGKITCFCCHHEVTLSAEFLNDPWRYHAMASPTCIFLLMKMGWEYVSQVCESMYDLRLRSKKELPAAVIDHCDLQPTTTPMGELFDLRKGVTKRKKTEIRVALTGTTVPLCSVCCNERRAVALMSCLHIATCVDCSFAIRECPLCRLMITGYMMPVFQPDGSFWKQPDCVGGNYFINLPCGHLIESCVPNNANRCPRADAVEEDEIYCVVCGNSKLGKLKVYI